MIMASGQSHNEALNRSPSHEKMFDLRGRHSFAEHGVARPCGKTFSVGEDGLRADDLRHSTGLGAPP